jgi:hypothetical protein
MAFTPEHRSQLHGLRLWAMKQGQTPAVPTLETCLAYAEEQAKKFLKDEHGKTLDSESGQASGRIDQSSGGERSVKETGSGKGKP